MANARTPAHKYYEDHVVPALAAWRDQPLDLQLAMSAALDLYHVADYYWHSFETVDPNRVANTPNPGHFRARLAQSSGDFAVLRDVAEAHKHMKLDRKTRIVTASDQTNVGATAYGEGPYGEGPYGGGPSIVIELDDGTKRHLCGVVDGVEALWKSMLA